ncbi:hypothetical protein [Cellulomonas triticagri]|uniref:Uncharacterized protein n=1 Tax=Cellulomonas triticagri TaxID=2483352 RepID=A0A3M2JBB3_9CELL|nr:hypothetical protein [Cellulomonas triticagri]RMI09391.1 hypothetical protein EBM89_10440 [Cellulomonas triticagri]
MIGAAATKALEALSGRTGPWLAAAAEQSGGGPEGLTFEAVVEGVDRVFSWIGGALWVVVIVGFALTLGIPRSESSSGCLRCPCPCLCSCGCACQSPGRGGRAGKNRRGRS